MGACCCCASKRKGSVDNDSNAPEILYFPSDQEISPQRRSDASRAPLVRPENFALRIGNGQVRRRDISNRSESDHALITRDRLNENVQNDSRQIRTEQADARKPRPVSAPYDPNAVLQNISMTDNKHDLANARLHLNVSQADTDETYSESNTLKINNPRNRKRRGSLEPILFEDDLGSPTEVWLGAQFPDSESNDTDASSCDNGSDDRLYSSKYDNRTLTSDRFINTNHNNIAKDISSSNDITTNDAFNNNNKKHFDEDTIEQLTTSGVGSLNLANHAPLLSDEFGKTDSTKNQILAGNFEDSVCLKAELTRSRRALLKRPILSCVGSVEDPVSKTRYLVTDSMRQGYLDYETCAQLLEGQILSGGIIGDFNKTAGFQLLSVEDAIEKELIAPKMYQRLKIFEQFVEEIYANKNDANIYQSSSIICKRILDFQSDLGGLLDTEKLTLVPLKHGMCSGNITKQQCAQIANRQVASGGIVQLNPFRRINLELAEKCGLVDNDDVIRTMAFETLFNGIRDPLTQEPTTYAMCVRRGLLSCHDVIEFLTLQAISHGGWVRNCFTHEWLPITRAMHEGVIDVEMWESVVRSIQREGKSDTIIHPLWLRPVSYFDLLKSAEPEIPENTSDNVLVVQAGDMYQGIYDPRHHERISICEALNRDLTDKHTARRLLKAQLKSGGLVDISRKERIPLNDAVSRKVVNFSMAVSLVLQQKV